MRWLLALVPLAVLAVAADTPPPAKITPGKVVIPTDRMRRIWGELVSIDFKTRTGTFRNQTWVRACSKSAIRSSGSSMPMLTRTRLSVMPRLILRSSGTDRWVMLAG